MVKKVARGQTTGGPQERVRNLDVILRGKKSMTLPRG